MFDLTGTSLGRYHIIEQLGEGGMASVYKGFDTLLERNVAVKVIRTERGNQPDFLKRFQREARALARLDHPYILKVLDYGEQDGTPYLVMPFVSGGTLKGKLTRRFSYPEAAALLAPVARALEYAHRQGVIHRDVKPANILIDASGTPLLSDFGIAKMLDTEDATQLTGTGVGIGTPDYMAPEQWLGNASRATDIYALGVVFYEMVTGKRPFVADTPAAVLLKHMNDPLPRPKSLVPDLPDSVESVIFKALAKKPEDRFTDMGAFAAALEALAREEIPVLQATETVSNEVVTRVVNAKPVLAEGGAADARPQAAPVQGAPVQNKVMKWTLGGAAVIILGLVAVACVAGGLILYFTRGARPAGTLTAETPAALSTTIIGKSTTVAETAGPGNPKKEATQIPSTEEPAAKNTPFSSIDGLPEDVPVLLQNNGDLTIMTQQEFKMYMFTTPLTMKEVIDFYNEKMIANGWQEITSSEQPGQFLMKSFQKDDGSRMVNIMAAENSGTTMVTIQVPSISTQ